MDKIKVVTASTMLCLWALSAGAVTVTPADAMSQVGHPAKVCGVVASTVYEGGSRARPTFVTLISAAQPSASQGLTAVIYGTDRGSSAPTRKPSCKGSVSA